MRRDSESRQTWTGLRRGQHDQRTEPLAETEQGETQAVAWGRCDHRHGRDLASYIEKGVRFLSANYTPWLTSGAEGYLKNLGSR